MSQQITLAIQATLKGDWQKAIELNLAILKENPKDLESLNRLAFAYTVIGKIKEAKSTYNKVLKIDNANPIALKNIKRLGETATRKVVQTNFQIDNNMFLEEVGKTKIISLVNTAPPKTIRMLQVGQAVVLSIKRLKIFVLNEAKQFLGMLPDNISKRLIKFMKGGNLYASYIKAVDQHGVTIFIKETKRVARFKNQPSFVVSDIPKQSFNMSSNKRKNHEVESDEETSEE